MVQQEPADRVDDVNRMVSTAIQRRSVLHTRAKPALLAEGFLVDALGLVVGTGGPSRWLTIQVMTSAIRSTRPQAASACRGEASRRTRRDAEAPTQPPGRRPRPRTGTAAALPFV